MLPVVITENRCVCLHCLSSIMAEFWNTNFSTKINDVSRNGGLFDLLHKQCNGIIKGWLHCLMSESNGRFLVNHILLFSSVWSLVTGQIQFSLTKKKKNKDWTSRKQQKYRLDFYKYIMTSLSDVRVKLKISCQSYITF